MYKIKFDELIQQKQKDLNKKLFIAKENKYKVIKEISELNLKNSSYNNFINNALVLSELFQNKTSEFSDQITQITKAISKKKEKLKQFETNIKANYENYNKNNNTYFQLLAMHKNYISKYSFYNH